MDDFLFAWKKGTNDCTLLMDTCSSVCFELGVPIADEKSKGPVTNLVFLGLEIDTIEMVIKIPHEKLIRLKSLLVTRTPAVERRIKISFITGIFKKVL